MRISSLREELETFAIDHVYYRSYSPLVRCVGREYTPYRSSHIALLVAAGKLDWTPDVVEAMYWSFNSKINQIWNRDNAGPAFDIDEASWDRPARADIVDAGKTPAFVKEIEENVKKTGNIYGVKDSTEPIGQAEVVYVVDDTTRAKTPEIADAVKKVLDSAGVSFTILDQGTDGWALYDLGLWELATAKAKEFADLIKKTGAKTVVANCPAVVYALREWYPEQGMALEAEILHHTEYFDRLGLEGKFEGEVTFHDPSYLGRYLDVYDAPRNILGKVAGLSLVECYFNKDKANPSGPLAGYFNPEWAQMVAARRAGELALAAKVVVTAAPASKRNLSAVADDNGIKVVDIAEILAG